MFFPSLINAVPMIDLVWSVLLPVSMSRGPRRRTAAAMVIIDRVVLDDDRLRINNPRIMIDHHWWGAPDKEIDTG